MKRWWDKNWWWVVFLAVALPVVASAYDYATMPQALFCPFPPPGAQPGDTFPCVPMEP